MSRAMLLPDQGMEPSLIYAVRRPTKYPIGFRYRRAKAASSTTSTRRSPDSHFETNDCGTRSRFET